MSGDLHNQKSDQEFVISALASSLAAETSFMSFVLARYGELEGIGLDKIALFLGVHETLLDRLALCRRPSPESPDFVSEVSELADFALVDTQNLLRILRLVDACEAFTDLTGERSQRDVDGMFIPDGPILAAARDKVEEDPDEPENDETE